MPVAWVASAVRRDEGAWEAAVRAVEIAGGTAMAACLSEYDGQRAWLQSAGHNRGNPGRRAHLASRLADERGLRPTNQRPRTGGCVQRRLITLLGLTWSFVGSGLLSTLLCNAILYMQL
jgi:hypothetical protein